MTFSKNLKELTNTITNDTTFEDILKKYAEKDFFYLFGFLLVLFSFPIVLPIPSPGYGTFFGIIIIFITVAAMLSSSSIQIISKIPQKIKKKKVGKIFIKFISISSKIINKIDFFIKPRFNKIYNLLVIKLKYFICFLIIIQGIMLSLLVPLPFSNTIPAIIILILGLGIMNKDGLSVLIGTIMGILLILISLLFIDKIIYLIF